MNSKKILFLVLLLIISQIIISLSYFSVNKIIIWLQKIDITLEINESAKESEISAIITKLKNINWVVWIEHKKSKDSLKEFKKNNPWITSFIERYNIKNPIPDILVLKINDISAGNTIFSMIKLDEYSKTINQQDLDINNKQQNYLNRLWLLIYDISRFSKIVFLSITIINVLISIVFFLKNKIS